MNPGSHGNGYSFIRANASNIILVVLLIVGFVGQWTIVQYRISQIDLLMHELTQHELDRSRHVDPERDERRWQELLDRLDRIEAKLNEGKSR